MSRSYAFVFTQNNYPDTKLVDNLECQYIIYGKEVGESGTPHLQGYVKFNSNKSVKVVRKLLPGCHIEIAKTMDEAIEYCKKEGDFTERGKRPLNQKQKGECNIERYKRAKTAAQEGRLDDIDPDIYIRHYSTLKKISSERQAPPAQLNALNNEWLYGPPGSGKSSKALKENPNAYLKGLHKWWDGYNGQDVVIVDDLDQYHRSLTPDIKQWAHHHPFPVEKKGGVDCIRPKKIIITSNFSIDEIWEDSITREAMHRRFTEIEIKKPTDKTWHYSADPKIEKFIHDHA